MLMFYIFLLFNHFVSIYTNTFLNYSLTRNKRNINYSIVDRSECSEIKSICNNLSENDDLLILECLLSTNSKILNHLNKSCQHVVWEHTKNLIQDESVKSKLLPSCSNDLNQLNCGVDDSGNYLKCILNNINNIHTTNCIDMLIRLENVAFTDYMWISSFLQHCTKDINNLKCGRVDSQSFTQINTVNCLQNNILNIQDDCKREVFHLSELQSENIKLDAQLYSDCSDDYMRYCSNYGAGNGRVFSCLMQHMHKDQSKLRDKCQQHLLRRQKLIVQDYRISKGLLRACKDDIRKTHCRKQISSDKTVRLAQILLCLENMMKNGTTLDSECKEEMIDHRKMLMEDYRLSPEIVNNCKNEISIYCKGFETGGKTIHCLMDHALLKAGNSNTKINDQCMRALEDLVKETDVGENWSVDPILQQACYPVVKVACKDLLGGDAKVMSCLMDKLGTDYMNEECENALIQIQYFVARDFKLDPQLYRGCKRDAIRYCHVRPDNVTEEGPAYGPEVLPCLYR
ncbi:Golgi apparatus protein 1-like [Anoplophora glabripennis]|uniref:Golgi apparatus protein 1-like n=1 Tax=Anoplophora glabripennis TaxID=217634 RepID=UPI000873D1B7|nr:Golgi apparatus protein 1-like [Anoplophora glabripennis]